MRFLWPCLLSLSCSGKQGTADSGEPTDSGGETTPAPTYTAVRIDFDELTEQIAVDELYAEHLVFEVDGGYHLYSWEATAIAPSPPYAAYTTDAPLGPGVATNLSLVFTRPVRALQFTTFADTTSGPLAGVRIETETGEPQDAEIVGDGDTSTGEVTDLGAHQDITRVEIHDITDDSSVAFDDFLFEIRE
jgi:hypothetical protein